ncbi:exopolyphosphatase [Myroides marinus]|uniref:Exopolyphosphatase / guanosine-5'-triphosphate,3'-diphosphate pyrophosphatase n=1 Tax=Myroides marinus TaxID=703342 RepID=A0A1H6U532_9FLAO|nr:exopolyphosphatase [Myroides marinus]MDM1351342.1 exopolyphosphatase [Myroides marinus]MDM1354030.1 exopolyphosphatase [Myroides marinus]MDM1358549.1 exopolyphosphatase [Myroides marinus]MDM1361406.1 exopolyphosphatase [Myroides marinus]MDM1364164.1 exopolyphosphatase [Myroides marinus]
MLNIKKYAAIDIGSNAMRLLIMNIIEEEGKETIFSKSSLIRVPIRLGQDVFTTGAVSSEAENRMVDAMKAFFLLMKVNKVDRFMACATSAMREATNAKSIVDRVYNESGIKISIIDGKKEAMIIASSDLKHFINSSNSILYIDVGGGSTEFTLFDQGKQLNSKSFKNGTVRLLNNMVEPQVWKDIEQWIKEETKELKDLIVIGSGGNINKIFKLSGKAQDKPLSYFYLHKQLLVLSKMSYDERISVLGLNPDRADVIIPAINIYNNAMKWSGAKYIYVPKIGVSDGIVKALYYNKVKLDYQTIAY